MPRSSWLFSSSQSWWWKHNTVQERNSGCSRQGDPVMLKLYFFHSPAPFLYPLKHPCCECQKDSIRKNNCHLNLLEKKAKPPISCVEFTRGRKGWSWKHHLTWQVCLWEPRRMFDLLQTSMAVTLQFQGKPPQFWEVQGGIQKRHWALSTREQEDRLKTNSLQRSVDGEKRINFSQTETNSSYWCFWTRTFLGNALGWALSGEEGRSDETWTHPSLRRQTDSPQHRQEPFLLQWWAVRKCSLCGFCTSHQDAEWKGHLERAQTWDKLC